MTAREPNPRAQFSALLSRFPRGIVGLVKRCLPKLRRALPVSHELVYPYPNSLVVAFGMSERGVEAIVALAIDARRVRLYLSRELPDPKGLLEGSGTRVRSVTLESASDLDHGDIHELLHAAIRRSGVTFPESRSTRRVLKSASKQRRPGGAPSGRRTGPGRGPGPRRRKPS
jgi:hypothetical protein